MKHLKKFEGVESSGEVPFDTLIIIEVKTIFKSDGVWHDKIEKFAGIRNSTRFSADVEIWRGGRSQMMPVDKVKKFWVV